MPQQPQPPPPDNMPIWQKLEGMQWAARFPALTLMVFLRRDLGYRMLNPVWLGGITLLMIVIACLANGANRADDLLVFALVVLTIGLHQRYNRWLEIRSGCHPYTYYIGTSILERLSWPAFFRRDRRIARFIDPLVSAVVGFLLLRVTPLLAVWILFSSLCLRLYEQAVHRKEFNRALDTADGLVDAEIQSRTVEHFLPSSDSQSREESVGIPTGLGDDIQKHIRNRKPTSQPDQTE